MSREVLVVDDNEKIVEVLKAYLDIMLPGIDGIELTKRFQREHGLPVILVTARSDEVDRLIGLEVGADDYISKPFSPREVVARVKAVLRRVEGVRSPRGVVRIGGLEIDAERRRVSVDGEACELTRTEFDILAAMADHPGRVYSRLQLLEAATGDAYDGYERTVDAHVKNIRKKLGEDPRSPRYVHTVFGVGYKVEDSR